MCLERLGSAKIWVGFDRIYADFHPIHNELCGDLDQSRPGFDERFWTGSGPRESEPSHCLYMDTVRVRVRDSVGVLHRTLRQSTFLTRPDSSQNPQVVLLNGCHSPVTWDGAPSGTAARRHLHLGAAAVRGAVPGAVLPDGWPRRAGGVPAAAVAVCGFGTAGEGVGCDTASRKRTSWKARKAQKCRSKIWAVLCRAVMLSVLPTRTFVWLFSS